MSAGVAPSIVPTREEIARWRSDTPGCAHRNHLNNAGAGLMPRPVLAAIEQHLEREAMQGGYEAADAAAEAVQCARQNVGKLIGAEARNVAFVGSATDAYARALGTFDFVPGDIIVTTRNDYVSNQLMFLSLAARRGVRIERAHDLPEGGVDPESVRELISRARPCLVAVTWVPTNSGLVQPVEAVGKVCQAVGVPYLIDACQAVGQIPIDVGTIVCDFLAATARKFLRGPRGIGFLYVSDLALQRGNYPLLVDMRGAKWTAADRFEIVADARRFEQWEVPHALVLGLGAAAQYADAVGVERAGARARELAAYVRTRLGDIDGLRVLDRGRELCAISTVEVRGFDANEVVGLLRQRGINTSGSYRVYAQIDMAEKHAESAVRLSPHYYNTTEEIDTAVAALTQIAQDPLRFRDRVNPPLAKA